MSPSPPAVAACAALTMGCVALERPRCSEIKAEHAVPGSPWAWLPEISLPRPSDAGVTDGIDDLRLHDVDEDGRADLVLNHRGASNRLYLGRVGYCGAYEALSAVTLEGPLAAEGAWVDADFLLADIDGAHGPEFVWNDRSRTSNVAYVGRLDWSRAEEDGAEPGRVSVRGGLPLELGDLDWRTLYPAAVDVDHDGLDDVLWTTRDDTLCAAIGYGDPSAQIQVRAPATCWTPDDFVPLLPSEPVDLRGSWTENLVVTRTLFGDRDADGGVEVWINAYRTSPNTLLVLDYDSALEGLVPGAASMRSEWPSWGRFEALVGDVDGSYGDDVIWLQMEEVTERAWVYASPSTAAGGFDPKAAEAVRSGPEATAFLGSPRGEPSDELIVVVPGDGGVTVDVQSPAGPPPDEAPAWLEGAPPGPPFLGDVDGDELDDLVFVETRQRTLRVRVALAREQP